MGRGGIRNSDGETAKAFMGSRGRISHADAALSVGEVLFMVWNWVEVLPEGRGHLGSYGVIRG